MSVRPLAELEARVRRNLDLTSHPTLDWMPRTDGPDGAHVHDVAIAGAGQGGVAVAFQLMRERVTNVLLFDKAPRGLEGPWSTYARMPTLRSPKDYTGPDLGLPSLTYRAWHEARFGDADWSRLDLIPAHLWAEYLLWVRDVTGVVAENETELVGIAPAPGDLLALRLRSKQGERTEFARKLVLATGQDGAGRWLVPDCVKALPRERWSATDDAIAFEALAGKDVAVLGAGASAADNASMALEAGARTVNLFVRRTRMQRIQPYRWLTFSGFLRHYADLDDAWRWRFMSHILGLRESIPQPTYDRMRAFANFEIVTDGAWLDAKLEAGRVKLSTPRGVYRADYLISCIGMDVDFAARPELRPFAGAIQTWGDVYTPPKAEANARLARYPYLDANGAYREKAPGTAPFLRHIYDFAFAATMSQGASGCSINAMKIAAPRLAAGLTRALFRADIERHWASLQAFDTTVFEPAPIDRDK